MNETSNELDPELLPLLDDIVLQEDDLTEEAKNRFSYHHDIFCSLETYRCNILGNEHLTPVGRHLLLSRLDKLHTECKRVLNYMTENSELLDRSLPNNGPLIICGLPRTGSTLLYNLLNCDSDCRAPLYTEMVVESVPPISRSNLVEQERRSAALRSVDEQQKKLTNQSSDITKFHPSFAIDEDFYILYQAGLIVFDRTIVGVEQSESDNWLFNIMNKHFAYDYHQTFLRMLNSVDAPHSHWLLKAYVHNLYLDTILGHYPNAALIMTHRRLDEVIPSFCSFMQNVNKMYYDQTNSIVRDATINRSIRLIDKMIECIVKFRTKQSQLPDQSQRNIFDVTYDDLMEQPITTVHRIYDYFGLRWSDKFEKAMEQWLFDNPQGKQGRHSHNLAEICLTHEDIKASYAQYTKLFLRSSILDVASSNQPSSTNT